MKYWTMCYPGDVGQLVRETLSEEQILRVYFGYWSDRMREVGKADQINNQDCIEDWVVGNWAWETDFRGEVIDKRND